MTEKVSVKVSSRYQIAVPRLAREQLEIETGDRLLVDVQDGLLVLLPCPQDYTDRLAGLHREIWYGLDHGCLSARGAGGMDIVERLAAHATVGLDTSVFIYQSEARPRYLPLTQVLFAGVEAGRWTAVTSTITLMELAVRPWQLGRAGVAREYKVLLVHFPHLTLLDVTRDVARREAQLRAEYQLRPADALQIGTALVHGATAFVSNDRSLLRLAPVLDIVILDDLIAPGQVR